MPNACLTGDLVPLIGINFWTSKAVAIIRAMWVIGGCLNKIAVLVARGRKRGFWVSICSLPISSQLIPYSINTPKRGWEWVDCSSLGLCRVYKGWRKCSFLLSVPTSFPVSQFSSATACYHSSSHLQAQCHTVSWAILLSPEVLGYTCPPLISSILAVKTIWDAVPYNEHETVKMQWSYSCYIPDPRCVFGTYGVVIPP